MQFDHTQRGGRWSAELDAETISAANRVLLRDVYGAVASHNCIRVTGRNGAAKAALVRNVVRASRLPVDKAAFLPQELRSQELDQLLAEVTSLDRDLQGRIFRILARLGLT